jgi:NAD(P) transhydrogenase subunit alpha
LKLAVLKEARAGERRVALVPAVVARLVKAGLDVCVESGAGEGAFHPDAAYAAAGARIIGDVPALLGDADVVIIVGPPGEWNGMRDVARLRPGAVLIGFLDPWGDPASVERLAKRRVTALAMELIPRISRAQSMDALTSQAVVTGYKAMLLAADALGKFFPMLMTAAATIPPARVLVIGAGVAGLEAIATAHRLGATVEAFDIRPAAKEEVESLGARFIQVQLTEKTDTAGGYATEVSEAARRREHEVLLEHVARADVVVATAQVPGKRAPLLVTADMVAAMQPGSVIVDVAAEQGGNCAVSVAGREVVHHGVTILGPVNLPATMPVHASQMYARNVAALLQHLLEDGRLHLDFDDVIIDRCCMTHDGAIRHAH